MHRVNYYTLTAVVLRNCWEETGKISGEPEGDIFLSRFYLKYYLISFVTNYQSVYKIFVNFVGK